MSLQVGCLRPEQQGCSPLASKQLLFAAWKISPLESGELQGTPLIRTPLGSSTSVQISELSAFQGLLKYGGCGLLL